uniref:Uncharacterized protein n=1 Tax=Setaria viridis TaxID=4556 RepID=A0A4U6UAG8_SETVI|nr:hypothetical protein SEVIR_5G062400v2 [Setaria viridis]
MTVPIVLTNFINWQHTGIAPHRLRRIRSRSQEEAASSPIASEPPASATASPPLLRDSVADDTTEPARSPIFHPPAASAHAPSSSLPSTHPHPAAPAPAPAPAEAGAGGGDGVSAFFPFFGGARVAARPAAEGCDERKGGSRGQHRMADEAEDGLGSDPAGAMPLKNMVMVELHGRARHHSLQRCLRGALEEAAVADPIREATGGGLRTWA